MRLKNIKDFIQCRSNMLKLADFYDLIDISKMKHSNVCKELGQQHCLRCCAVEELKGRGLK